MKLKFRLELYKSLLKNHIYEREAKYCEHCRYLVKDKHAYAICEHPEHKIIKILAFICYSRAFILDKEKYELYYTPNLKKL